MSKRRSYLPAAAWPWVFTPQFVFVVIGLRAIELADDYLLEMLLRPWTGVPSKTTLPE